MIWSSFCLMCGSTGPRLCTRCDVSSTASKPRTHRRGPLFLLVTLAREALAMHQRTVYRSALTGTNWPTSYYNTRRSRTPVTAPSLSLFLGLATRPVLCFPALRSQRISRARFANAFLKLLLRRILVGAPWLGFIICFFAMSIHTYCARIRLCTQELLIFREDLMAKMLRHCIVRPTQDTSLSHHVQSSLKSTLIFFFAAN